MSSLTWRISAESAVFPGQHQTRTGMAVAGDGHADHDLGQVVAVVLGLAVGAEPGRPCPRSPLSSPDALPSLPRGTGASSLVQLEVGGGGVEEQQVDFKVQQVRDLAVHLLLQLGRTCVQPVHRPVARVIADRRRSPSMCTSPADPVRCGELGGRGQRPVGDQREQHPLGGRGVPRAARPELAARSGSVRCPAAATAVQHVRAAVRPRPSKASSPAAVAASASAGSSSRASDPTSRRTAARSSWSSRPKLCSTFGTDRRRGGVPLVMRQVQVADLAALDLPGRRLHIHPSRDYSEKPGRNDVSRVNRFSRGFQPRAQGSHR